MLRLNRAGRGHRIFVKQATYYFVTLAVGVLVFVLVASWLNNGVDDAPFIIASLCAVAAVGGLVLFEELYLRPRRVRAKASRKLSKRVLGATRRRAAGEGEKFSLSRNEDFLNEISKKSEAAKVLGKFADAHKEVYELCESYLELITLELDRVRVGSPRIAAFRKGSRFAKDRHRFHMLKWAEISSRSFSEEARSDQSVKEKIDAAENARSAVDRAIVSYPDEPALTESRSLLESFILTARVGDSIEAAEMEARSGNGRAALDKYKRVLRDVDKFDGHLPERPFIRNKLMLEIEKLSELYG